MLNRGRWRREYVIEIVKRTTKRERAWAALRKGQAYAKLGDTAAVSVDRDTYYTNAIQAFDDLNTTYGSSYFGVRPAGEGAIEKANIYAWGKGDYTTAVAIAQQIVGSYPADANQYPRAYAYFSLGQYYRDMGWKQKNTYGQNYLDEFQTALTNYSYVRAENFPLLDRITWFFLQVPRWIGECYSGMGDYPLVRSYFASVLSSASFSAGDKAWVQLSLAKSYGEEVQQLVASGSVRRQLLIPLDDNYISRLFALPGGGGGRAKKITPCSLKNKATLLTLPARHLLPRIPVYRIGFILNDHASHKSLKRGGVQVPPPSRKSTGGPL